MAQAKIWTGEIDSPAFKVDMHIDMGQLDTRVRKAQYALDGQVMMDMIPKMPMITGGFIQRTHAMSSAVQGTGIVYAAAPPYGRFLYEGKVMVDEKTGSPWARKGARKVLLSQYQGKTDKRIGAFFKRGDQYFKWSEARENLTYTKTFHPFVTAHWFEVTKAGKKHNWVNLVAQKMGGK